MEMLVFGIAAAVSYWYETEVFLFMGSAYVMCRFLYKWYMPPRSILLQNIFSA